MSSLWTPSGEHRPDADGAGASPSAPDTRGRPLDPDDLTPEEQAQLAAELRRMQAELAATPVVDIVANHAVGLWQLAVLHLTPDLEPETPVTGDDHRLDEARLAIDAFAALVEGLGSRLGPHEDALRDALTQLRLAYVEVSGRLD